MKDIERLARAPYAERREPVDAHAEASWDDSTTCEALVIGLEGRAYGIDVRVVQDVRDYETPVPIANAPALVPGGLYALGRRVPLVDLRAALGLPTAGGSLKAVTILQSGAGPIALGVSAVGELVRLDTPLGRQATQPPNADIGCAFIAGIGRVGDRVLPLLDVEALAQAVRSAMG